MTRSANLRVISGSEYDQGQGQGQAKTKTTIIATTEPALFEPRFSDQSGQSVFVIDNGTDALKLIDQLRDKFQLFFADFRQLDDRWTGQRFLKHIRATPALQAVKVYIMAERWEPHQEQWVVKCGGEGFVRRAPDVLAKHILGASAKPQAPSVPKSFAVIEEIFGRYAGPMRGIHIEDARKSLELGMIEPSEQGYIDELEAKLSMPERKASFRKQALEAIAKKKPSDEVTQAGDPWQDAVNKVFRTYAGALGAKLLIQQALEAMEATGNNDRSFYVQDLANRLLNPARRADFLNALKKTHLMD